MQQHLIESGNSYAGIDDTTSLSFTTPDIIPATLTSSDPADNATAVAEGSNIVYSHFRSS